MNFLQPKQQCVYVCVYIHAYMCKLHVMPYAMQTNQYFNEFLYSEILHIGDT